MPFVAGSITIGGEPNKVVESKPLPVERTLEGSFQSLKEKAYSQLDVIENKQEITQTKNVAVAPSRSPKYRKKTNNADEKLIEYKESAFLSDMLSSSKD